jgi:hypothetical protein
MSLRALMVMAALAGFVACESNKPDVNKFVTAAKCTSDDNCGEGFICKDAEGGGMTCQKGARTAAEKKAAKKAKYAAKKAARDARRAAKPGEGRMQLRLCGGFKNTPESIGTIIAVHQETKKRHFIHLAREVDDLGWEEFFAFWSVPLGKYDVTIDYGVQKGGVASMVKMKCDARTKMPCRDEVIREVEVVLAETPMAAPLPKNKEGKVIKPACDWLVE